MSLTAHPGYPGQPNWPENGNHYRVSVMQPDGKYHLEKGENRGDETDFFVEGDEIGPGKFFIYPNTDSYRDGIIRETGIRIYDILQNDDLTVSFSIDIPNGATAPLEVPDLKPPPLYELSTTYSGDIGKFFHKIHEYFSF